MAPRFIRPNKAKLNRAALVLKLIRVPFAKNRSAYVDTFNNCREQGYSLVVWDYGTGASINRWFTFSEYRNTDDIVVYSGEGHKPSTGVDDASYATKRFFSSERDAAAFISGAFA